ncbi:MAG: hypothetical protein HYZ57_05260, partial [Acidobacteria bacterium]|nr:hypothetical protein [Acidobacteriota bacterium]
AGTLACPACGYQAANDGGVYNLLPSAERRELYPGDREDLIDFSQPGHERRLLEGWYEAEGVFGNRYRWIAARATARLARVRPGAQRLRLRGHAHEQAFTYKQPVTIEARANGARIGQWTLDRSGLFLVEADLPDAPEYTIEILAGPTWQVPTDDRVFSVNISFARRRLDQRKEFRGPQIAGECFLRVLCAKSADLAHCPAWPARGRYILYIQQR